MPNNDKIRDLQDWIRFLEKEWSKPEGFLGKAREGYFDLLEGNTFADKLESISLNGDHTIPCRLVALLWYIPVFLSWQKERISENGGDMIAFERLSNRVQNILERILGIP